MRAHFGIGMADASASDGDNVEGAVDRGNELAAVEGCRVKSINIIQAKIESRFLHMRHLLLLAPSDLTLLQFRSLVHERLSGL